MISELQKGIIVSCQAYEGDPFFGAENILKLALSAQKGGAAGLRLSGPENIRRVRAEIDLPIVGIYKIAVDGSYDSTNNIIITPTYEAAAEIIEAGCDVVGMDGRLVAGRTYDNLKNFVEKIKKNYPHVLLLADISTVQDGKICEELGFDILSSTLSGYVHPNLDPHSGPDYELIGQLKKETSCYLNAEGRIWELSHLDQVMKMGADLVTIGSAITYPHLTTGRFNARFTANKNII